MTAGRRHDVEGALVVLRHEAYAIVLPAARAGSPLAIDRRIGKPTRGHISSPMALAPRAEMMDTAYLGEAIVLITAFTVSLQFIRYARWRTRG